jgi:phosphatidylserine/phosphatidylglycerophosphate/cardiolipin synthase-like enzyme
VLTNGSGFPAALVRAHDRGVDVRVIADRRTPCACQEGVSALAAAGIPVWIDTRARVAHEKALIIDRRVTIMGSYNFSAGAALDSEDLNVVTSEEVADEYASYWQTRQAASVRFAHSPMVPTTIECSALGASAFRLRSVQSYSKQRSYADRPRKFGTGSQLLHIMTILTKQQPYDIS